MEIRLNLTNDELVTLTQSASPELVDKIQDAVEMSNKRGLRARKRDVLKSLGFNYGYHSNTKTPQYLYVSYQTRTYSRKGLFVDGSPVGRELGAKDVLDLVSRLQRLGFKEV